MQGKRFSELRTLARNLGATPEDRRADFGADDKSLATIERIAKLRVPVNSSFILMTQQEAFVLETVASEIGADPDKIDECIDDDDDVEINLIKLIFETDGNFLFWEHTPKPETKKQKVTSGRAWIHCQTTDKKAGASPCFAFSAHSQQQHTGFWRALHEYVNLGR